LLDQIVLGSHKGIGLGQEPFDVQVGLSKCFVGLRISLETPLKVCHGGLASNHCIALRPDLEL
jgi:hypothetical protein